MCTVTVKLRRALGVDDNERQKVCVSCNKMKMLSNDGGV